MMTEDRLEDVKLASFEQGYKAGWDDAIRAQADDQSRIMGVLGRNLEDLSFTYQEALVQMMAAVEPVFQALVETVLPEAMMQTIGLQIVEQCRELAAGQLDQPVKLVVPVGSSAAIRPAVQKNLAMKVDIQESDRIGAGQVFLRLGDREREIDTTLLLSSLRESIEAFSYSLSEAKQYG
ncbi:ABC transporter ATP-binding protein [Sedimentitalea sp. JM2-8]|uniref:ABC transporter ATP-binding protein n=1 Tax=Sedimentitalea xiamensis TaxID=3050037 RepID=A0ABT7FA03_9RHOB|nr:ABC transporter ATP-binding protein [Sedimentitalea xiamensis]MDK3071684.1 ABC transporter ATP-binding protein [Sedimentitalea xiamensis]